MKRHKVVWHERNGLTRAVIVLDNIHIGHLVQSLKRAPKIINATSRVMERGEKLKDRRD